MLTRSAILTAALLLAPALAPGVAPAPASAEIFVIPLTGVDGTYAVGPPPNVSQRTTTFHLPGIPAVVRGVSLHAVGTTFVGTLICDDGPTPTPVPWPAFFIGAMEDAPNNAWEAEESMPFVSGPIDVTAPFATFASYPGHPTGTWAFLSGGTGVVTLSGDG